MTTEFRSCDVPQEWLFETDLKMCYMITATLINANIWDYFFFFFHSSFSMDWWSLRLERAKWSSHSTGGIWESITVALKHFLQHSYHFQHILCTYYLSSWGNAGFAVRKLCDCEIETEVIIRLRTGVLCHRMMSVSILFTFLEEEHGTSVSNSSLFYAQHSCINLCSANLGLAYS